MRPKIRTAAKERSSYPLRLCFARSGKAVGMPIPDGFSIIPGALDRANPESNAETSGYPVRSLGLSGADSRPVGIAPE
jgi:hypothetical protein